MTYTEPLLIVFLSFCTAGFVLLRRTKGGRARKLLAIGILGLFFTSWHPAAWLFSRPLEIWFRDRAIDGRGAQAIVVPGADYDDPTPERPFPVADHDTYGRCRFAAWLYRNGMHQPVIVSGHWATGLMRHILESEGVPPAAIWEEKSARSTHENAAFSARILRAHSISSVVVVSEARSMLRTRMCFQKEGLQVMPAVWRRLAFTPDLHHLLPGWEALKSNEETLHEAVGLLWYRLRGWI